VSTQTLPTVIGHAHVASAGVNAILALPPRITGLVAAQTDLPSSISAGSITASNRALWTHALP